MRIYTNFKEAQNEIRRDLAEMGILVKPKTYQNKDISQDDSMNTRELQNYSYTLLDARPKHIPITGMWTMGEWSERLSGIKGSPVNPGEAWKSREKVWSQFLNNEGKFDYSYGDRLHAGGISPINKIIDRIKVDPDSRQLWCPLWHPEDSLVIGGKARVPCTLGYNFQVRDGKINIHYLMRSCDFATHYTNDVFLACKLLEHVGLQTGYQLGNFTHTIFSLHIYERDVKDVF